MCEAVDLCDGQEGKMIAFFKSDDINHFKI